MQLTSILIGPLVVSHATKVESCALLNASTKFISNDTNMRYKRIPSTSFVVIIYNSYGMGSLVY